MTATNAEKPTRAQQGKKSNLHIRPGPTLELPETIEVHAQSLKQAIKSVLPCAPQGDKTRPVLNNVLVEASGVSLALVAVDGFHICAARLPVLGNKPAAVHKALLDIEEHAEVIAARIAQHTVHPARITFQSSDADLVSNGVQCWYQAKGITINANEIGRVAKGNTRPLPHDYLATTTARFPDWRRVLDQPEDKMRAVVRLQVGQLRAIIPSVADYAQLAFYPDMLTVLPAIKDDDGTWYDLAPSTLTKDKNKKMAAPLIYVRGDKLQGEKHTIQASLLRNWLSRFWDGDILQVHYYGADRLLYIRKGEQDDGMILEYGIMPMTIRS